MTEIMGRDFSLSLALSYSLSLSPASVGKLIFTKNLLFSKQ
jgi:hypothetical protein